MSENVKNNENVETLNNNEVATSIANKFVGSLEEAIASAQRKENILFYGKIAIGIAAIAGISYFAYDRFFSSDEKLIVVSDAASL